MVVRISYQKDCTHMDGWGLCLRHVCRVIAGVHHDATEIVVLLQGDQNLYPLTEALLFPSQ